MVDRTGDYGSQFFGIGACMVLGGLLVIAVGVTSLEQRHGMLQNPAADQQDAVSHQQTAEA